MRKMLDYAEALALITQDVVPVDSERLPLAEALGRYVAEPVLSPCDLPGFANAAMDGYSLALPEGETLSAGSVIATAGSQAAGDAQRAGGDTACEIMTGARMPEGHNTVVMVEQTEPCETDDGQPAIRLSADVHSAQNVRLAGEDVACGGAIFSPGQLVSAAGIALASALGVAELPVRRRLRIGVICTGRELVDDLNQELASGQIRNSNGPYLAAVLAGPDVALLGPETVTDDSETFLRHARVMLAQHCDVLLTTGAVSMGRYDFIPKALTELGATPVFHKARIRPGKPVYYARLAQGTHFFGLPGNPVSAAVGERFFVRPLLRRLRGQSDEHYPKLPLHNAARGKAGLQGFMKARVCSKAGVLGVEILPGQESFKLLPLVQANAWALIEPDDEALNAGHPVAVAPMNDFAPVWCDGDQPAQ